MKRIIFLIPALLMLLFAGGQLDAQFVVDESPTLTWDFDEGTEGQTAIYSGSTAEYFNTDVVTNGSNLTYTSAKNWRNQSDGGVVLDVFTAFTTLASHGSPQEDDHVSFNIHPLSDFTLTPKNISFDCGRFGTDGGAVDVAWVSPDGTETTLATGIIPARDNSADFQTFTSTSIDLTELSLPVSKGSCALKFYIYSLNPAKEVGFGNIIVECDVVGVIDISVAHWDFDEGIGTTVADISGENDGVLLNGGTGAWTDGLLGKGLDFTAKDELDTACYVIVPNSSSINFADEDFTVSTIVKINDPTAAAGETSVWSMGIPGIDIGGWYSLSFQSNALKFEVSDGTAGSPDGTLNGEIYANEWTHIVCVRDAQNDLLSIYVNGVLFDQAADLAGDISSAGNFYIGAIPFPDDNGEEKSTDFDGAIDELAIFDRILSPEEILLLADGYRLGPFDPAEYNISFITDDQDDSLQIKWLEAQGYIVTEWWPAAGPGSQTAEEIEVLNNSDLVIIGRSPGSTDVGIMKNLLNGILAPVMNNGIWGVRDVRMNLFDSGDVGHEGDSLEIKNIHIKLPNDRIFEDVSLTPEDSLGMFSGPHDFLYIDAAILAVSNAEVVASNDDLVAIARFKPAVEYYPGSVDMPAGYVTYWGMGNDVTWLNFFPLTADARIAYAAELERLIKLGKYVPPLSIAFVSDDNNDSDQVEWLEDFGYKVDKWWPAAGPGNQTSGEIDVLNSADLVIIGRSPGSTDLGTMKDDMNGILAPVLNNNIWGARKGNMNLFDTGTADHEGDSLEIKNIHIKLTSDPIFKGFSFATGDSLGMFLGPHDFLYIDDTVQAKSNAEIVASNDDLLVIARFEPNVEYYPGSVDMPAGHVTYWGMGNDVSWINYFPLTDDAKVAYAKEIDRLIELGPTDRVLNEDCSLSALSADPGGDIALIDGTTRYSIEIPAGTTTVNFTAVATHDIALVTGDLSFDASGISEGSFSRASITVTAEDGTQCTYRITVNKLVNIEPGMMEEIEIYPNPVSATLTVTHVSGSRISIYAINGAQVMNIDADRDRAELDVAGLNSGIYIMKIQMKDHVKVARFIKK